MLWDRNTEEELAIFKRHYTHGGKKIAFRISKIGDYVMHVFREHDQDADHWANLGAEGQRKIVVDSECRPSHTTASTTLEMTEDTNYGGS